MRIKQTCSGCRALGAVGEGKCGLGYKTDVKRYYASCIPVEWKPLELCPKPMTYDKYYREVQMNRS